MYRNLKIISNNLSILSHSGSQKVIPVWTKCRLLKLEKA